MINPKGGVMYKRAVVSFLGWLIITLFIVSSAWAAASKDGKKSAPKMMLPQATLSGTGSTGTIDLQKFREANSGLKYITYEQRMEGVRKARSSERASSVYDAATGIISESPFFTPGVLTETAPENYDTAGFSYYDYNANDRNPRTIAITRTNNNVGVAWTKIATTANGPRTVFCALWKGASKTGGNFLTDIAMSADLTGRGGFCGVTYTPKTGKLVFYAHHAEAPEGLWYSAELNAGQMDWSDNLEAPDSVPGDGDVGIWPTAAGGLMPDSANFDANAGTDTLEVIHFFSNEGLNANGNASFIYGRILDSAGIWIHPDFAGNIVGYKADSGSFIVPTVVASKKSARVALIYTSEDECNFSKACSEVYYIESRKGGNDWVSAGNFSSATRINITNYGTNDRVRAAPDLMGVYDNNDSLVISYLQLVDYDPSSGNQSVQADAMVWTKAYGSRKAVDGNFPVNNLQDDTRRQTVNWPHVAVHDGTGNPGRTNYLYLVWTQYSGPTSTEQGDTSIEGFYNGDVYISASTNGGKTWSAPINATNSHTPACPLPTSGTGTCSGVDHSSCAERANDTIHIGYMTDEYPGYYTAGSGENPAAAATANEMIYMKYPAFTPTATIRISTTPGLLIVNPGGSGPSLAASPTFTGTDTFFVQNIGNANMTVDSIRHKTAATWLTINNGTGGFSINEGDPDIAIGITANDASLSNGVYYDTVRVYNNSANKPVVAVPVYMIVDNGSPFFSVQFDSLKNNDVKVSVSNVSNIGNQSGTLGFYRIVQAGADTDTTNSMYDASSFLAVKVTSNDSVAPRFLFGQVYMQPMRNLTVGDTTIGGGGMPVTGTSVTLPAGTYRRARYSYAGFVPGANGIIYPGPYFGFKIEERLFLPKPTGTYVYKVSKVKIEAPPTWWTTALAFDSTTAPIYYGMGADWDVFTTQSVNSSIDNYGRSGPGTGLTWQEGAAPSPTFSADSNLIPNGHFGFIAHLAASAVVFTPALVALYREG